MSRRTGAMFPMAGVCRRAAASHMVTARVLALCAGRVLTVGAGMCTGVVAAAASP